MSYLIFESKNGHKLSNLIIFKSGFSTLAACDYFLRKGEILPINESCYENAQISREPANNSINFCVLRDPFYRVVSLYRDIITNENSHLAFCNLHGHDRHWYKDIDNFMKCIIQNPLVDSHTLPSAISLNWAKRFHGFICKHFILMEGLNAFIDNKILIGSGKSINDIQIRNISRKDINVEGFDKYQDWFHSFYKEDYDLINYTKGKRV